MLLSSAGLDGQKLLSRPAAFLQKVSRVGMALLQGAAGATSTVAAGQGFLTHKLESKLLKGGI